MSIWLRGLFPSFLFLNFGIRETQNLNILLHFFHKKWGLQLRFFYSLQKTYESNGFEVVYPFLRHKKWGQQNLHG